MIFDLDFVKNHLFQDVETLKTKYFNSHPDDPVILHRKEILNKKYPFKNLRNPEIEKSFNQDILNYFMNWEYTVISVLIDKFEHHQRYTTWKYDPYHYCLEILSERFYRFLMDQNSVGDVMVESRGGKEDTRLKKAYRRIFETGTNYIDAKDFENVLTSRELKVKPKSANIAGLQIADLLAFPARRYILRYYGKLEDKRQTFNEKIIDILKEKFYKRGNKIEGYGFKLLP